MKERWAATGRPRRPRSPRFSLHPPVSRRERPRLPPAFPAGLLSLRLEVGRYISLERLVEQNKERYYESSNKAPRAGQTANTMRGPAMNFLLFILTQACKEFERRVGQVKSPHGERPPWFWRRLIGQISTFRVADVQTECPGVGWI